MPKQSVRIQLKDGGEVEVASEAIAKRVYPDAKIVQVTTWDTDGVATTEPYNARATRAAERASEKATEKPAETVTPATSEARR